MKLDDWVRVLNFLGSVVLFYGSFRNQRWTKIQSDREAFAATEQAGEPDANHQKPGSFNVVASKALAGQTFDRYAFRLLCGGFFITSIASFIDILDHSEMLKHFFHLT